ncbi:two-component system response regulator [Flavobacterium cyanobacteriorum]|uniref:Two-component system response regulator n=1 Tax=Flavobacterium cyanobacteriorum TaxID=2022802 RepID=A0A255YVG1_9FLAO|nr:response regulator [Flavobacterium cyanobacteriorum]OYQ33169.1 two-component system response regulator [Flavobacterium cyanobacteriorum]
MNTKIRCLLLDDELPGLAYLKMLCEQIPELEVIKAFNSPEIFLREQNTLEYDLLISDIEMPGLNGLQVADAVRGKAVVFTTAYKNFAVDAFDRDAVDYVVKPVKPERLMQAVKKVMALMEKPVQVKQVQLNTDRGKALITTDRIFCIMTSDIDSRDKVILLNDNSRILAKNLSFEKLLELLPQNDFVRINKRAAIALKHVQYYSHDEITADINMPDGRAYTFPLSEIYRAEFARLVRQ